MALSSAHIRSIATFAVLGAVSGGIGALALPLQVVPAVFYGVPDGAKISFTPAIVFALALGGGLYFMRTRRVVPIAAMMAAVLFGWWIAVAVAACPKITLDNSIVGVLHWLAAGLAGAFVVGATGAMVGLYERNFANVAEIAIVGTLVVLVSLWVPQTNFWLLLMTWQAAVSAATAHAIVRSEKGAAALPEPRIAAG